MTIEEYRSLCKEIWYHNKKYYSEHAPDISDEAFDTLLKRLEKIETEHSDWITPTSPTQRVGETLTTGFQTVSHHTPMLSLANTYSREEIEAYIDRMVRLVGKEANFFSCELKMDGIAVSALFEKGIFKRALTRGDGKKGDDISANFKTIHNSPLRLYGEDIPDRLEVRGEVYMPQKVFESLNKEREEIEEAPWANPRNAAAGTLKLLDPNEVSKRGLKVVFYGMADNSLPTQYETHDQLNSWGLPTLELHARCSTLTEIWSFSEKVLQRRNSLPFAIDGIVIKLDDVREHTRLGNTGKNPRWAVAYKFAAEQATTKIHAITVQVGRTGVLTPVAELEPVSVAGSTISRATLHNADEVRRKDVRVADTVVIEKGGDVIPKVVKVLLEERTETSTSWEMPTECPSCQAPVTQIEGEVAHRCTNSIHCPAQQIHRLLFFASKKAMDIDTLGEKVVQQLFERGYCKKPSDIYRLTPLELFQLEGFKAKSVDNLINSIEKSKILPLDRFIHAIGIPFVGLGTSELLANKAGTLQALMKLSKEDLLAVDGIGEKVADSVVIFFADPANRKEIDDLQQLGVQPQEVAVISYTNHPFAGKSFVLTGTLHEYTRQSAAALIKERGGKVVGSVSKKTDWVLAGENPGSKIEKAVKFNIKVINEIEFKEMA